MIELERVSEVLRLEGPHVGKPVLELLLGEGSVYNSADDLVKEVYLSPGIGSHVLVKGEATTQVGMGEIVKNLYQLGFFIEMESRGDRRLVSWFNAVRCWIVDFVDEGLTDYNQLRKSDSIRINVGRIEDIEMALPFLNSQYDDLDCGTYMKLLTKDQDLFFKSFNLVKRFRGMRLFSA